MTFTFHRNSLKLAGLYLTIIVCISLFFSAIIYQQSIQELDRGLRRPQYISQPGENLYFTSQTRDYLQAQAQAQYEESRDRVLNRLIITNLFIALLAGVVSYLLAVRTLRPIEEANESLERFTADASHELRTPLAAMKTEIEVALMDPKLKITEARAVLESNLEELDKLTGLSEGLLKLARHETDHLNETVGVDVIIDEATQRLSPMAAAKQIVIDTPKSTGLSVLGDRTGLTEVMSILVDNAIKYSPEKSKIMVTTEQKQKRTIIAVADEGIGIKAVDLPHIFERFYRSDAARSKQQVEGYGIGLALAKHIIDLHQGTIEVASQPDKGTTVTVSLPSA